MPVGAKRHVTNTRPSNTDAYVANDVITQGALRFDNLGPGNSTVLICLADLLVHVASVPAGMGVIRMHLYSRTPPSAYADNAAWDLPAGDREYYQGYIDIGTPADVGGSLYVQNEEVRKPVQLSPDGSLYVYGVTVSGYTPTSAAVKRFGLGVA